MSIHKLSCTSLPTDALRMHTCAMLDDRRALRCDAKSFAATPDDAGRHSWCGSGRPGRFQRMRGRDPRRGPAIGGRSHKGPREDNPCITRMPLCGSSTSFGELRATPL